MADTEHTIPDPRTLTFEELTRLADRLLSRGVTITPPFAEMPEHQAELRTASAALRLLASHKAGFARIAHGHRNATVPINDLNNLSHRLDAHVLAITNFPARKSRKTSHWPRALRVTCEVSIRILPPRLTGSGRADHGRKDEKLQRRRAFTV
jgi:hypothetical protein